MRTRIGTLLLGLLIGVVWLQAATLGLSGAGHAGALMSAELIDAAEAQAQLREGEAARRQGRLREADRRFRLAWMSPETRERATAALHALHKTHGFKLPVDEGMVSETLSLLGEGFVRTETSHFVILSDADPQWTRSQAQLLERARHQLIRVSERMNFPIIPHERKLLCVLFQNHAMYRAFARAHDGVEAEWVAGYYSGASNRVVFYDDVTGPNFVEAYERIEEYERAMRESRDRALTARRQRDSEVAERYAAHAEHLGRQIDAERLRLGNRARQSSESKTIHEAVHLLAFNTGLQSRSRQYPFWITEGLATTFESGRPNAAFGPDHSSEVRESEFRRVRDEGRLLPLTTLLILMSVPDNSAEMAEVMYAQSYTLFTYLYRYERRALGRYLQDIWSEPPGSISPETHLQIFRTHFGDPERLERVMLSRL